MVNDSREARTFYESHQLLNVGNYSTAADGQLTYQMAIVSPQEIAHYGYDRVVFTEPKLLHLS
jgi:hypothetical protein